MFDNIGSKMKWLARVNFMLGLIGSAIYSVVIGISSRNFLMAILTFLLLSLVFWIGSWVEYALGEAADNVELQETIRRLDDKLNEQEKLLKSIAIATGAEIKTYNQQEKLAAATENKLYKMKKRWECSNCGVWNDGNAYSCKRCGFGHGN